MISLRLTSHLALLLGLSGLALAAGDEPGMTVDEAFVKLSSYEVGQSREPLVVIAERVRAVATNDVERAAIAKRLAAAIAPSSTRAAIDFVCRELSLVGGAAEVPVLAALLLDEKLSDSARYALERMPDPAAASGLREALSRAKGVALVGVIHSLGEKRDRDAVALLAPLARSPDATIAGAALFALGKIGSSQAASAITTSRAPEATDALLACAEQLLADGQANEAAGLYDRLDGANAPRHVRIAALRGLVRSRGERAIAELQRALVDPDVEIQGSALALVRDVPGKPLTTAIVALVPKLPRESRILVVAALGDRGDTSAAPGLATALSGDDEAVRVAALLSIPRAGDASIVPLVAKTAATAADPDERTLAEKCLEELAIPGADAALQSAAESGAASHRAAAIRALAPRLATSAVPILRRTVDAPESTVRVESIRAIGALGSEPDLPLLAARLVRGERDDERTAAQAALASIGKRLPDRDATTSTILAATSGASPKARAAILRVLGAIGGDRALETVRASIGDDDGIVRVAAIESLAGWPDVSPISDLLSLSRESIDPATHGVAVAGVVRLAGLSPTPPEKHLAILSQVMASTGNASEKRAVLAGFATVRDPAALAGPSPYLSDPTLAADAQKATAQIAAAIADSHREEARAAVTKLLEVARDEDVRRRANETLERIERFDDYVTTWLVAGPFAAKDGASLFETAFAPEKPDAFVAWEPVPPPSDPSKAWLVDLAAILGGDQRAAYLRAQVRSPRAQEARLEIGSDDGIRAWLNGALVHSNDVARGVNPGEDRVSVTLREGWNDLLLKVVQAGGGWGACARFRALDGKRLAGLEVRAALDLPRWTHLFDRHTFYGWTVVGDAAGFEVRDGAIHSDGGKGGNWLRSTQTFGDFVLKLDWRVSKSGNSGVFVRCAESGEPWVTGHEIQITNEPRDDLHCTGSLYGTVAASPRPDESADRWHTYEIHCRGSCLTVIADGRACVDVDADQVLAIRDKPRAGYIGLQDSHTGPGGSVDFRNVRILDLDRPPALRVLAFSKTAEHRHDSIPAATAALRKLGAENGFSVEATEDAGTFTDARLAPFDVVIFLLTTGDVLDDAQQAAFERFVRRGGGFVGVHSASDTEYGWPWYGELVGAWFQTHPKIQSAVIRVEDRTHPATAYLPENWTRTDEWYDFRASPRGRTGLRVLASLDAKSYEGSSMTDHPIAWCREWDGGRAFYTGLGHTIESWSEPEFLRHLLGGLRWAAHGDLR